MKNGTHFILGIFLVILFCLMSSCSSEGQTVNPNDLISIIKEKQRQSVRESCNLEGCCCFTWLNLEEFKQGAVVNKITGNLQEDSRFNSLVSAPPKLPESEWNKLKKQALSTR